MATIWPSPRANSILNHLDHAAIPTATPTIRPAKLGFLARTEFSGGTGVEPRPDIMRIALMIARTSHILVRNRRPHGLSGASGGLHTEQALTPAIQVGDNADA